MPRNGSGVYTRPAGTDGIPDTTIESGKYNSFVGDVETDLNTPRPVVAGGTGATSAAAARANLKAEVAATQVTNYDSHVFETGSFYSLAGATLAPSANGISGTAVVFDSDPNYITLQARDIVTGTPWMRIKTAGTWGAWSAEDPTGKVNRSGDTMTGLLTVPRLTVKHATLPEIQYQVGSITRWAQDADAISYRISNYDASGISIGTPITIANANGAITIPGPLNVGNFLTTIGGPLNIGGNLTVGKTGASVSSTTSIFWGTGFSYIGLTDPGTGFGVFSINNFGAFQLPSLPTTAAAANLNYTSGAGDIKAVTSSLRYKANVEPLQKADADRLLALQPITYRSKCMGDDPERTHLGFIAEDVAEVEPRLVLLDGESRPNGLAYDRISVLAVYKLQEQEKRIEQLLARIELLEAKLRQ